MPSEVNQIVCFCYRIYISGYISALCVLCAFYFNSIFYTLARCVALNKSAGLDAILLAINHPKSTLNLFSLLSFFSSRVSFLAFAFPTLRLTFTQTELIAHVSGITIGPNQGSSVLSICSFFVWLH